MKNVSQGAVESVILEFLGEIEQTPSPYFAKKVKGRRAYYIARQGKIVELSPKVVTIYGLSVTKFNFPLVQFKAVVSSGTYIRSLAHDIGKS